MRTCLSVVLMMLVVGGCAASEEDVAPPDAAVAAVPLRRQLTTTAPTRLAIVPDESAGTIGAARREHGEWVGGSVELGVESGAFAVRAEADGTLEIRELTIELAPIELPESLLGQPARFVQVRVGLREPVHATTTWVGQQLARGDVMLEVDLQWALTFAGTTLPIGAPDLEPIPATIEITGGANGVHAALHLHATGAIWEWASYLQIKDLDLALGASAELDPED